MHETTAFADACRRWTDVIDAAAQLDEPDRVEALAAHLVHVYAAGLRLPPADRPQAPPPDPRPWPSAWPGLGELEAGPPTLSLLLRGVTSDVTRGMAWLDAGEPASALGWWRSSFDARWGLLAVVALERLHRAVAQNRTATASEAGDGEQPPADPAPHATPPGPPMPQPGGEAPPTSAAREPGGGPQPTLAAPEPGGLLSFVPAPPQRRPTGRHRARAGDARGVLGLRFEPVSHGLHVTAVHPSGPAAGQLEPGDVLAAVDGLPLAGRTLDEATAALAGPPGQTRSFQVARGVGLEQVDVTAVAPEALAAAPVTVQVLVLDRDAAGAVLPTLEQLGVQATRDPDQEGLLELLVHPEAAAATRALLGEGEQQGWWEVLGG